MTLVDQFGSVRPLGTVYAIHFPFQAMARFRRSRRYGRRLRKRSVSGVRRRRVFRRRFRRGGARVRPGTMQRGVYTKHVETIEIVIPNGAGALPLSSGMTFAPSTFSDAGWFGQYASCFQFYKVNLVKLKFHRPYVADIAIDTGVGPQYPRLVMHTVPVNDLNYPTTISVAQDLAGYKFVDLTSPTLPFVKRMVKPRMYAMEYATTGSAPIPAVQRATWVPTSQPSVSYQGFWYAIQGFQTDGVVTTMPHEVRIQLDITTYMSFKGRKSVW